MPSRGEWAQFIIATAIGCAVYLPFSPSENSKGAVICSLACGYFGMRLVVFLYVWVRYGWRAARSMSMEP